MYVSRVSLQNVRSFRRLDLDFSKRSQSSRPLHTVLIGANGTGKTTLLRAIAVGVADRKDTNGLLAEPTGQFVGNSKKEAIIEIEIQQPGRANQTIKTVIASDNGQDVLVDKTPEVIATDRLVCGYGISRANEGPDPGRTYRVIDSVYTLFQYEQPLIQTELALRRLEDFLGERRYQNVLTNIKKTLGLRPADSIETTKGGGVTISGSRIGKRIPLEGWADGYRKTLAWILDLYAWAMRADCVTETGDVRGLVLVDEIEQHLHPSMQAKVLSRLCSLLPYVQIIATTHSPLVALGSRPEELVVLRREGRKVFAYESVADFRNSSVEDLLADRKLFNSETYAPEIAAKLQRYRKLAGKSASSRSAKEQSAFEKLATELASQEIPEVRRSRPRRHALPIFLAFRRPNEHDLRHEVASPSEVQDEIPRRQLAGVRARARPARRHHALALRRRD